MKDNFPPNEAQDDFEFEFWKETNEWNVIDSALVHLNLSAPPPTRIHASN